MTSAACGCSSVAEQLPESCSSRPCISPTNLGDDRQILLNSRLLAASSDGDLAGIRKALSAGADIETRKPMMIRPRSAPPQEPADDPIDLPAVLGPGDSFTTPSGRHHALITSGSGLTPLMRAAKDGHAKALVLLLEKRAVPYSKDEDGMTALHFAAMAGCQQSCEVLLRSGANAAAVDDCSRDAYASLPSECVASRLEQSEWAALLKPSHRPKSGMKQLHDR